MTQSRIYVVLLYVSAAFCAFGLSACGANRPENNRTILSTGPGEGTTATDTALSPEKGTADTTIENASTVPADLRDQLIKDGKTAAGVLLTLSCDHPNGFGIYATVYSLRVGLHPEPACVESALERGVNADSILLRALAWRHLVTQKNLPIPREVDLSSADPTVRILAALAFLTRSLPLPDVLRDALSPPSGEPVETNHVQKTHARIAHISAVAGPFDDGLLAAAVALAETQFSKAAEVSDAGPVWTAARIRNNLLNALGLSPAPSAGERGDEPMITSPTAVGDILENPTVSQPEETLCNIALNAPPPLRIEALRALVIRKGDTPAICALGAAAAAMRAEDTGLRIEGARTFLVLIRAARR